MMAVITGSRQISLNRCIACLTLVLYIPGVAGFGTGAPKTACVTLQPGHSRTSPQTRVSPYRIDLGSVTSYTPGQTLTVKITGGVFEGFLLQARPRNTSTPVGYFHQLPPSTKFLSCDHPDDSFTHADSMDKEEMSIMWTAPDAPVAEIEFRASVARNRQTYWVGIRSSTLKLHSVNPNEHVITAVTSQWPDFTPVGYPDEPYDSENNENSLDGGSSSVLMTSTLGVWILISVSMATCWIIH